MRALFTWKNGTGLGDASGRLHEWGAVAIVLAALLILVSGHASAGVDQDVAPRIPPVVLDGTATSVDLAGHIGVLVDEGGALSLADVVKKAANNEFMPVHRFAGAGHTEKVFWYRTQLIRRQGSALLWVLAMGLPSIDHVDVFMPNSADPVGGEMTEYRTGDFIPYSQRPIRSRLLGVPLDLEDGKLTTIYIRVQSVSAISFFASVQKAETFMAADLVSSIWLSIYQGAMLIVILFYGFLGIMLIDWVILAYLVYVTNAFFFYLFYNGLAVIVFPDMPGWLINLLTGGTAQFGATAVVFMWDKILNLKQNFPRAHRIFMVFCAANAMVVPLSATHYFMYVNAPAVSITMAITFICLIQVFILMKRERDNVMYRYYFVAFLVANCGAVISQLALYGMLPTVALTKFIFQLAIAFHVIVLGLGLAHRVRHMQIGRIKAEQEVRYARAHAEEQRSFLAMLSHEFRTPLASIDSAAQLIESREGALAPPSLERLSRIRAVSRRLCELVDLFLSSEALDQGALALNPEVVELRAFLEEVLGQVRADDPTAPVSLAADVDRVPVRLDPQFMSIALTNLVVNALRYSPDGAPVTVEGSVGASGLRISVSDRGFGMTSAEVERIGAMYFRAASSHGTKGVGIGLYITKKIVVAHGGSLEVASEPDRGTTFTIRLAVA